LTGRDGKIRKDEAVQDPPRAAAVLQTMPAIERLSAVQVAPSSVERKTPALVPAKRRPPLPSTTSAPIDFAFGAASPCHVSAPSLVRNIRTPSHASVAR
jgi:hypothetical protein